MGQGSGRNVDQDCAKPLPWDHSELLKKNRMAGVNQRWAKILYTNWPFHWFYLMISLIQEDTTHQLQNSEGASEDTWDPFEEDYETWKTRVGCEWQGCGGARRKTSKTALMLGRWWCCCRPAEGTSVSSKTMKYMNVLTWVRKSNQLDEFHYTIISLSQWLYV